MQFDMIQSQSMGIGGIPGTFPTGKVKDYLNDWGSGDVWTRVLVNDLYRWYKEAVQVKGLPNYIPGSGNKLPTMEFIKANTGQKIYTIQEYLEALQTLAKSGEIDNKWLSITKPESSRILPDFPDIAEKAAKSIKWVGIGVASLAALYFLGPMIKKRRQKR